MTTNPTTTDYGPPAGEHGTKAPSPPGKHAGKPRKRAFIWVFFLVIVGGVTGYAVWRASQPGLIPQTNQSKGGFGGGRGKGGAATGPLPVVVAKARSGPVPIYLS